MQTVEVETLAEVDDLLERTGSLRGVLVQSVDLTGRSEALGGADVAGAVFLGCGLEPQVEDSLRDRGALIFPRLPDLPFNPYRGQLYSAAELYAGLETGYASTPDAAVYAWTRAQSTPPGLTATLAMSLHDHAVGDALDDALAPVEPRLTVGLMGGHALERTSPGYLDAAVLGARLAARGRTVLTGGGPGAMEAANLGAHVGLDGLDEAVRHLSVAPSFRAPYGVDRWATSAWEVREAHPPHAATYGIPTWFYGHEPPNLFATGIAKYFSNALREDTLLARCRGGIVYLPGAAGTVQEIFQAVTEVYYTTDPARMTPIVLVGVDQWTNRLPAWPLLRSLAAGRAMERLVHLVDTVAEAEAVLLAEAAG